MLETLIAELAAQMTRYCIARFSEYPYSVVFLSYPSDPGPRLRLNVWARGKKFSSTKILSKEMSIMCTRPPVEQARVLVAEISEEIEYAIRRKEYL